MSAVLRFPGHGNKRPSLHFSRSELSRLLGLYSRRVMSGEWRDYAISFAPGRACFFIFRHSQENPLFVISKLDPRGRRERQGRFLVTYRQQKLRQSNSLEEALAVFNQPLKLV
jgi:hypothetical protein